MTQKTYAFISSIMTAFLVAAFLAAAPLGDQSAMAKTPVPSLNLSQSGLALRGYDPVAYFTAGKPVKGSTDITLRHGGGTYHFSTEQNRNAFQSNPAKYLPQYGGFCSYGAAANYKVDGDPKVWNIVDGKLYLNINKSIDRSWDRRRGFYIKKANSNWPKIKDR